MFLLYLLGCQTSIQLDFLTVLVDIVFTFIVALLLVVRGGTVCLPMPPCWLEVKRDKTLVRGEDDCELTQKTVHVQG